MSNDTFEDGYIQRKTHSKKKFTPFEDQTIVMLVNQYGTSAWRKIANMMDNRTSRQVKERWYNYLKPGINHSKWTEDEEKELLSRLQELGPRWKLIATFLENRTEVDVKNHYRMMKRRDMKKEPIFIFEKTSIFSNEESESTNQSEKEDIEEESQEYFFSEVDDVELFSIFDSTESENHVF